MKNNKSNTIEKHENNKDFLSSLDDSDKGEAFKEEKFVYQKTSNIKWVYRFAFVILVGAIAFFLLNSKTTVIDFTGMNGSDVVSWGNENKVIITLMNEYSTKVDKDHVITQSIKAGEKVEKNMSIVVTVSEGPDPFEVIEVPSFDQSWSRTSINRWLTSNGVENFNIEYDTDENVEEGYMISYKLIGAEKDSFTRSSEIEFVICLFEDAETITVQDFLNKAILDVDVWAKKNSARYDYVFEESSIYTEDRIISQSIAPGEEMDPDDTLKIIISSGTDSVFEAEDFLNRTPVDVDSWARKNGVNYSLKYVFNSIYPEGRIVSQSIPAGDSIHTGDTIVFEISQGEKVIIPDFSKINELDAGSHATDLNLTIRNIYMGDTCQGDFVTQSVSAGSAIQKGADITVTYSLGGTVYISDFMNKQITELEEWVQRTNNNGGNIVLSVTEKKNTGFEKGSIVSMSSYNEKIPVNHQIDVGVSESGKVQAPDFSTMSEEDIISGHEQLNIKITRTYKKGTNAGDFVSQSIKPGIMVDSGADIKVELSIGGMVEIGDYKNKNLLELRNWVREQNDLGANISLKVYEQFSYSVPYGIIISHDKMSALIEPDDEIKAIVSKGESYLVIPFQYVSREWILDYAVDNRLNIVFEETESRDYASGTFISQSPESGEVISKNSFITITYAK